MATLAVHVQRRLRGRQRHRDVLGRARCRCATRGVDPRLPTKGTGEYEWKGFLRRRSTRSRSTRRAAMLVNWNNRPAPGWGAADDNWSYGSVQRVRMLNDGLAPSADARPRVGHLGDERGRDAGPAQRRADAGRSAELLTAAPAPSPRATARCSRCSTQWRAAGSSPAGPRPRRRDGRRPGPGDLGRALSAAVRRPRCRSRAWTALDRHETRGPASGFTDGGFWYIDKDLRTAQRRRSSSDPFNERYCGGGEPAKCARARSGRRSTAVRAATRTRCARDADARSGSRSARACSRPRSATPTARAASSR